MSMAPEGGLFNEIFLNGVAPTIDTITSLAEGKSLRVWDPERGQMALVHRDTQGRLRIRTGDLSAEEPEEYDINPPDALKNLLEQLRRAKAGEAEQQKRIIEQGAF